MSVHLYLLQLHPNAFVFLVNFCLQFLNTNHALMTASETYQHINQPLAVSSSPQLDHFWLLSHLASGGFECPWPELLPVAPQPVGLSQVAQLLVFPVRK